MALKHFVRCRPPGSVFDFLSYADESRLFLARLLLEELAEPHHHDGPTQETARIIISLKHLCHNATSECHAAWRFRYLVAIETLPLQISQELEDAIDSELQEPRPECLNMSWLRLRGNSEAVGAWASYQSAEQGAIMTAPFRYPAVATLSHKGVSYRGIDPTGLMGSQGSLHLRHARSSSSAFPGRTRRGLTSSIADPVLLPGRCHASQRHCHGTHERAGRAT
jgi:hypothetical protein